METNPHYDIVIYRLHLYYNMQLVTFGIDKDKNLIVQFPVFIQPYTQQPLILYQIETVPVPIIDQNTQVQSYTHLQVNKPYIALNFETYISIRQQELRTCVLVNRSVLHNCGIEAENHFLLESLAACQDTNPKLTRYFTVNTAFANYLDTFPNLTESLVFLTIRDKTTFQQTLPTSLNISKFDSTLLIASTDLKEFINRYTHHKEIFDLQVR